MCLLEAFSREIVDRLRLRCRQNVVKRRFFGLSRYETKKSAEGQTRTVDTGIFSAVLYHLSYLGLAYYYRIRRGGCQGCESR